MRVDVVLLPSLLQASHLWRTVVVFDVLRATTTMAAALEAGVKEIRIFDTLDGARAAGESYGGPRLLCGESRCLAPEGFDLGNSPGDFGPAHQGAIAFMATTNGTRAMTAARSARQALIGALVNARATAHVLKADGGDITLLCAGTNGQIAMEDILGAGAVIGELSRMTEVVLDSDTALMAQRLFESSRSDLHAALSATQGGRNVINAGLAKDIDFAARLNSIPAVGAIVQEPHRVIALPTDAWPYRLPQGG